MEVFWTDSEHFFCPLAVITGFPVAILAKFSTYLIFVLIDSFSSACSFQGDAYRVIGYSLCNSRGIFNLFDIRFD